MYNSGKYYAVLVLRNIFNVSLESYLILIMFKIKIFRIFGEIIFSKAPHHVILQLHNRSYRFKDKVHREQFCYIKLLEIKIK